MKKFILVVPQNLKIIQICDNYKYLTDLKKTIGDKIKIKLQKAPVIIKKEYIESCKIEPYGPVGEPGPTHAGDGASDVESDWSDVGSD